MANYDHAAAARQIARSAIDEATSSSPQATRQRWVGPWRFRGPSNRRVAVRPVAVQVAYQVEMIDEIGCGYLESDWQGAPTVTVWEDPTGRYYPTADDAVG